MIIVGIDPSMESSGICRMELDDQFEIVDMVFYGYNKTKKWCINTDKVKISCFGTKYPKLYIYERIDLALGVFEQAIDGAEYVSIEDFSYGSTGANSIYQIGEFVGAVRKFVFDRGIKLDRYSPNSIKVFATSSHSASKFMMMHAFKQRYPDIFPMEIEDGLKLNDSPQTDLNDAFWIAEILRNKLKMQHGIEISKELEDPLTRTSKKGATSLLDILPEVKAS